MDIWRTEGGLINERRPVKRYMADRRWAYQREETSLWIYGGQKVGLSTRGDQSRDIWRTEGGLINEGRPVERYIADRMGLINELRPVKRYIADRMGLINERGPVKRYIADRRWAYQRGEIS